VAEDHRDHHGEQQVADEQWLDQRQGTEMQRHDLQHRPDRVQHDRGQPERPVQQVQQQPWRQHAAPGHLLSAALLGNR
jgi:hypothetical protein